MIKKKCLYKLFVRFSFCLFFHTDSLHVSIVLISIRRKKTKMNHSNIVVKNDHYDKTLDILLILAILYFIYLMFTRFLQQTYRRIHRFGHRWLLWPRLSIPTIIVLTLFIVLFVYYDQHLYSLDYNEQKCESLWHDKYRKFLDFVFDLTLGNSPISNEYKPCQIEYLYDGTISLLVIIAISIYSLRFFLDHHYYGFLMFIVAFLLLFLDRMDKTNQRNQRIKLHIIIFILEIMIIVYHIIRKLFKTFSFFINMIVQFLLVSSMIFIVLAIISHLYKNIREMSEEMQRN